MHIKRTLLRFGIVVSLVLHGGCGRLPGQPNPASTQSMANVRAIETAIYQYTDGSSSTAMPADLNALINAGLLKRSQIRSPYGRPSDGGAEYWFKTTRADISTSTYPDVEILIYDRVMYETQNEVVVGFYDGSVNIMSIADFDTMTRQWDNKGVDFDRPTRK